MRPDSFVIYLDENHCNNKKILAVLADAGVIVERHLDHFERGTPDTSWLPTIGAKGWILLTADKRIRYRSNEKQAVIDHNVRLFYFSNNEMSGEQMASALRNALPAIKRLCERQPAPFFAAITKGGEVNLREKFTAI
jgi:hypothetical protein